MSLGAGVRLGSYEILAPLGAGGMGEVYRAKDNKLGRDVAIKVLPAAFASDRDRMVRFQREAHVLASLNHPHIASIYGLEDSGTTRALVMELVEGPTLAERIAQGAISIEEALPIAKQIAEALEYAHEHGIVHRDLKPGNVKLTKDGAVKVLDFGLAKALSDDPLSPEVSNSPTLSAVATRAGIILGTAAYMSPEQAKGKTADRRSDIWSFGVVLYEMLTGRRLYSSDTAAETLALVLTKEPDFGALPEKAPRQIRDLMRRSLTKDPKQRLQAIGEARIAIEDSIAHPQATLVDTASAAASRTGAGQWVPWGVAGVSLAIAIALGAAWRSSLSEVAEKSVIARPVRFTISPPNGVAILGPPLVSPDGHHILFVGAGPSGARAALWLRSLDALTSRSLSGTEGASSAFWSPDSRRVGFFADRKLKTLDLSGGVVGVVCDAVANHRGGTWGSQDVIVFAPTPTGPLYSVSASGGTPVPATKVDAARAADHRWPQFLPDGRRFLFTARSASGFGVFLASLEDAVPRRIAPADARAWFAPPSDLLFVRGGALISQKLDLTQLALTGDAVTLAEQVGFTPGGDAWFSVSTTNVLVHRAGDPLSLVRLAFVDRRGGVTPVPLAPGLYADPALSPDGRHVTLAARDSSGDHIWVYDLARGTFGKRTFEGINNFPVWTPDGQHLTFSRGPGFVGPIMRVRADGSGQPETLVSDEQQAGMKIATSWSADGRVLAFQYGQDVMVRDADGTIRAALATPAFEREGRFAPGGRWLAYRSNETGRDEVYVQSYPPGGGKWQISTDGGAQPMWAPSGRELFYKNANRLMVAAVELGTTFKAGTPRVLVEMPLPERSAGDPARFAVTPDGQRFLVLTTDAAQSNAPPPPIQVVLNWRSGLK